MSVTSMIAVPGGGSAGRRGRRRRPRAAGVERCRRSVRCFVGRSSDSLRSGLDPVVDQDRAEQHHAEEGVQPVAVPAGVDDALVDHAVDQRAERGADRRAVATGQQAATDDGADDVDELLADTGGATAPSWS